VNPGTNQGALPQRVSDFSVPAGNDLAEALPEPYRTIFDQAAIGMAHVGLDGRFMRVNKKLCNTLGYPSAELLGREFIDITYHGDHAASKLRLQRLLAKKSAPLSPWCEKRYERKDGSLIWVSVSVSLVRGTSGEPDYFVAMVQENLTDLSADWYWEQDANFRFIRFSAHTKDASGHDMSRTVIGKTHWDLPYNDVSDEQWQKHKADLAARLPFRDFELKQVMHRGEVRYLSIAGQPIFDASGTFTGYRGLARDITERKSQEHKIARLTRIRAVLSGINALIVRVRTREELFNGACKIAVEDGKFGMAWIGTLNPKTLEISPAAFCGIPADSSIGRSPNTARGDLPLGQGMVGRAIRELHAVFSNDLKTESSVGGERRAEALRRGYQSLIVLPLIVHGAAAGNLSLFAKEANFFTPEETQLLSELAGNISYALEYIGKEEKLNELAYYDSLTGLPNRVLFQDRLKQALAQAQRKQSFVAVLFIDLDGFKAINDTLGHAIGDKLLQLASRRLTECVRSCDTVARFGGDEFALILSELPAAQDASFVAQKILNAFTIAFDLDGNETYITASIGITLYPIDSESMVGLIKNADSAMYGAKAAGRNAYHFYTAEMNKSGLAKMRLLTRMRHAIERKEFVLYYQPKVDAVSRRAIGLEALLRWQSPTAGTVLPAEFIPLLEETGLIVPVGEWVLRAACSQIAEWQRMGLQTVPVAINISGRQFQQPGLDKLISSVLAEHKVDPRRLEIEITESSLMQKPDDAIAVLKNLKALGIRVSVDDFGTGYSSLSYLKRFPLDTLKIDRSFVRDISVDADDAAITRAIVTMAHSLNLKVIAEGVETEEQLAFLRANRCDEAQGYLFSRPLSAADCTRLLAASRRAHRPAAMPGAPKTRAVLTKSLPAPI